MVRVQFIQKSVQNTDVHVCSGVEPEKLLRYCKRVPQSMLRAMLSQCKVHAAAANGLQPCLQCLKAYREVSSGNEGEDGVGARVCMLGWRWDQGQD